jgi:hypothetical protein
MKKFAIDPLLFYFPHLDMSGNWKMFKIFSIIFLPSETCENTVTVHCHRDKEVEVDQAYCSGKQKPETGTYPCNTQQCRPRTVDLFFHY